MLLTTTVKIPLSEIKFNSKYYLSKGYNYQELKLKAIDNLVEIPIKDIASSFSKGIVEIKCDYCNSIIEKTYEQYCRSHQSNATNKDACSNHKYDLMKENNLVKYGVTGTGSLSTILEKRKQTNIKKYGTENPMQNIEVQNKARLTNLARYGTENPSQNKEVQDRRNKNNIEKYGVKSTLGVKEFRNKAKQTMIKKYGVEYPSQSIDIHNRMVEGIIETYNEKGSEIQSKKERTSLSKYGTNHPMQNKEVIEQRKNTCIQKYGVIAPLLNTEIINKRKQTCKDKFDNEYYSGSIQDKRLRYNIFSAYILKRNCTLVTTQEEFSLRDTSKGFDITVRCNLCNKEFTQHCATSYSQNNIFPRCLDCFPYNDSYEEKSVYDYICSIYNGTMIRNDTTILNGKEIDILLPELKIGFEYNGCFWHSELSGNKDKNYHINKLLQAKEKGVSLFFIYDFEWKNKTDIVKSIISSKIVRQSRIYARKCSIQEVDSTTAKKFYDINHIQGGDVINSSTINMALMYDSNIVCLLSIGKPRFNKGYEYEVLRFANILNTSVVGGFSRLMTYFKNNYNPNSIITYSDYRLFNGGINTKNGFTYKETSSPNYFYIKYGEYQGSRYQYQKAKLKNKLDKFDPELTEWENMVSNGYDRVWDCGNKIFIYNKDI